MTRILFITATRLGDAVLSTGILDYLLKTYPDPCITIACGAIPSSLFAGMPGCGHVIVLKKEKFHAHWFRLWRGVMRTRWDVVVDLRNSAISRLIQARKRFIYRAAQSGMHKVESFAGLLGVTVASVSPHLWVSEVQKNFAQRIISDGPPVLAIGPAANWHAKTWPQERFIEFIKRLTAPDGILPDARVAVFAAPGEEDAARPVLESVSVPRRIDVIGKGDAGQVAAALSRCAFYVGNDSGLMHLAAAGGVPTLGLFGPSEDALYRPWGPHTAFVRTPQTFAQLIDYPGYTPQTAPCLMNTLTGESVYRAAVDLWNSVQISP